MNLFSGGTKRKPLDKRLLSPLYHTIASFITYTVDEEETEHKVILTIICLRVHTEFENIAKIRISLKLHPCKSIDYLITTILHVTLKHASTISFKIDLRQIHLLKSQGPVVSLF